MQDNTFYIDPPPTQPYPIPYSAPLFPPLKTFIAIPSSEAHIKKRKKEKTCSTE